MHVNERNQNKNKTKPRHIQIDHAFYCLMKFFRITWFSISFALSNLKVLIVKKILPGKLVFQDKLSLLYANCNLKRGYPTIEIPCSG